jgi:hypothetical protein
MVKSNSRSFAAIATSKRATFISYREAIESLAVETGDNIADVAAALKAADIHEQGMAFLDGPEQAVRRCTHGESIAVLLDVTIEKGRIEGTYDGYDPISPNKFGWIRESLVALLRAAELPCPESLLQAEPYQPHIPDASPQPRSDDAMLSRLSEAQAEAERLREEIARLRGEKPPVEDLLREAIVAIGRQFWASDLDKKSRPKADIIKAAIIKQYPGLSREKIDLLSARPVQ